MPKERIHREWFRLISKTTCECGEKKIQVYSWGEYIHGKWNTILHFCAICFISRIRDRLIMHKLACGCTFELVGYGGKLPDFITLD